VVTENEGDFYKVMEGESTIRTNSVDYRILFHLTTKVQM